MKLWAALLTATVFNTQAWAGSWSPDWENQPRPKRYVVSFVPGVGAEEQKALFQEIGMSPEEYIEDIDMVVAEARPGVFLAAETKLKSHPKVRIVEEDFYTNWLQGMGAFLTEENSAVLDQIRKNAGAVATRVRNRPAPVPSNVPWGVARVDAPAAWKRTKGRGVKVAVIDTGIDCSHPDLNCARDQNGKLEGVNYVDPKKSPMDDQGHGTHVAGTIAAKMTAKYVGVAPEAEVVPVKVLDATGGGQLSTVCKGIIWAARKNLPIASMSLGSPKGSAMMYAAVNYAIRKRRMTIIAAAGNGGMQNAPVSYPGAYTGVIAVAASGYDPKTKTDTLAPFSSRGKKVAFIAPGVDVWSTAPMKEGVAQAQYAMHSGTSMATPHVSGLAALAVTQGAHDPAAIRAALTRAATFLPGMTPIQQGKGMIDAAKLVVY